MIKFVTSNSHKYEEAKALFKSKNIELSWVKMEYEEIQAEDNELICRDSCMKLTEKIDSPFFIDDTGLYIKSLNGFPGPYASYVQSTLGNSRIMEIGAGSEAHFKTVIGFSMESEIYTFTGILNGHIAKKESGTNKFGYDPIFIPEGYDKTLAELSTEEKNIISHRGRALDKFMDFLSSRGIK
ncbi:non-canonical purine NTP pyrophosphatase [Ferroplasma acidiphilum]|uniref:Nucleoside-triphosphatase n=2 Tax=Ferroplasma TaxID=74968 RepID=S0AP88_FERAC|nr:MULTISPECIES: XTP/dITP diphosphatase [Ferroplasma]AGO61088.1 nucleoside-triphosphatase [Ferroplasma acidarmanus Fer1]ARD84066.1 non-canonical purine NTP pyrophosphatase [Ferroplasma acidiphilum]